MKELHEISVTPLSFTRTNRKVLGSQVLQSSIFMVTKNNTKNNHQNPKSKKNSQITKPVTLAIFPLLFSLYTLISVMADEYTPTRKSNTQILQELEELSENLYQSHTSKTSRRTASLDLPRIAIPPIPSDDHEVEKDNSADEFNPKPRTRRMSLSSWWSRPKLDAEENEQKDQNRTSATQKSKWADENQAAEKKGIWNWKPIRALTHIGMQKLSCLFSVEVVTVERLPSSMNGLRLSVCVRKKERKDGAIQTMPSRVSQGVAEFEETLFVRCHVYFTPGSGTQMKFEPRPFLIYVVAVDAEELDYGRNFVDLSGLIQESIEKSFEGTRVRQWDTNFRLAGKAKGGELVLKLGFQIMEKDGGIGIYSQAEGQKLGAKGARKQSKISFSVPSPRLSSWTPSQKGEASHLEAIDNLNLDKSEAKQGSQLQPKAKQGPILKDADEPEAKVEENDLPDFDVVDKGVEIQGREEEEEEEQSEVSSDKRSSSSEVVKEVVQDQSHLRRWTELDSIAQQIKDLESMIGEEKGGKTDEESSPQALDADEDKVTREFLQLLENDVEGDLLKNVDRDDEISPLKFGDHEDGETESFLPDLGKGLGSIVQTRNGGFLAALNPFDTPVARKDIPKLALQMSKPFAIQSVDSSGFEVLQKIAAVGLQELTSEIHSLMPMDELVGKTAEQVAFEGIASAIILGRNKEGATSSAARTITAVKSIANAMNSGRKERISTGIWNLSEDPLTLDEILAFSVQKIESLAVEVLKIQADATEEEAPFVASPHPDPKTTSANGEVFDHLLAAAVPIEKWIKDDTTQSSADSITLSVVVQLRDPMRQYEAVGGPMIALVHTITAVDDKQDEEKKYRLESLQVGGIKVRTAVTRNAWNNNKQKLTALQWLVSHGIVKAGKKAKRTTLSKGSSDLLWSMSSRAMADMWQKGIRNPDVKFSK